ncbi:MAG TPA: GAF domain-containing sensor histidine kinase [bacterium]|nr:GAF domain-containing sensor histidine kinase [bacterium]HPN44801.1 GAF domain-containing sensor histidine kinase [bacterium]
MALSTTRLEINDLDMHAFIQEQVNPDNQQPGDEQFIERVLEKFGYKATGSTIQQVACTIVDIAVALTQADRGILFLHDHNQFNILSVRNHDRETIMLAETDFSSKVFQQAMDLKQIVYINHNNSSTAGDDPDHCRLYFIMCIPLLIEDDVIGALYVDSAAPLRNAFRFSTQFFTLYANKAANLLRNTQYYENNRNFNREILVLKEQLDQAQRLAEKGRAASKVGHELNNILSAIQGNLDLVKMFLQKKESIEQVYIRLQTAQELLMNVNRYANSLLKNADFRYCYESTSLNQLVQDFLVSYPSLSKNPRIVIETSFAPDLPQVTLDAGLMNQVIHNLVKNALEAKSDCRILLKTIYDNKGHNVLLLIADDGPGMNAEKQARLFRENFTDKPNGNGYGLMICKEIVEKQGGTLSLKSQPGKGCLFIIQLPVPQTATNEEIVSSSEPIFNSWL